MNYPKLPLTTATFTAVELSGLPVALVQLFKFTKFTRQMNVYGLMCLLVQRAMMMMMMK